MPNLVLSFLGGFQAAIDDHPLTGFQSNKVRALLAHLAVEADRPHRRESLAALLWPEFPEAAALANLRVALSDLRDRLHDRHADPPFLLVDRESIQLNPDADVWVDVWEFEEQGRGGRGQGIRDIKQGKDDRGKGSAIRNQQISIPNQQSTIFNLQSSIALYRGPFLAGFSIPDSASFEEWLILDRERLNQQALRILHALADFYESYGEYEQALVYTRQQVELESWLEEAHRQIMRLLALSEQPSQALAQYESCKRTLADELGIEPAAETTRLYETIRAGRFEEIRRGERLPFPGEPPYKGLRFFDEPDAALFFGREALTARLVGHIREMVNAGAVGASRPGNQGLFDDWEGSLLPHILAVVGASGSGKSSLVRAGLAPVLRQNGWQVGVITPTAHPMERLETEGEGKGENRRILVIDQFEELFSLCRSEEERAVFLDRLLTRTPSPSRPSPTVFAGWRGARGGVVLVLRADFYGHCAQYPRLREALCARQEYIGPMSAAELRQAIEQPALRNGWEFEAGLVELILRDIGASQDHPPEPGALPLLEHALLETWRRRSGRTLTLKGYAEAGGVHGAIAKTAENVFTGLTPEQQVLARRIFLRLTELGEGTQDMRRRASLSELTPTGEDTSLTTDLLQALADARLITLAEGTAEVAHEALIREWPALRQWLSEDRDGLRLHRHLTDSAQAWAELEREVEELYRGARLAQALEWAEAHPDDLNAREREYLQASQAQAQAEAVEREAQRQRELETARRLAETERRRAEQGAQAAAEQSANAKRLRQRAWALAGVLGLALLLVVATFWLARVANGNAAQARANAQQANAEANTRATAEALAQAQQAVAQAERNRADDQKNAAQGAEATAQFERGRAEANAVTAQAAQSTAEAERQLADDNAAAAVVAQADADVQRLNAEQQAALAFARELASNAVLNLEQDSQLSLLLALQAVSVTQQAGIDPVPWEVQQALHDVIIQSRLIYAIPDLGGLYSWSVLFSPDGKWLAVNVDFIVPENAEDKSLASGLTSIRDASTGQEVRSFGGYPSAISPDGKWIAVDETASLGIGAVNDFSTGERVITVTGFITQTGDPFNSFSFSPDGNWLAWSGNGRGEPPRLWDLTAWRQAGAQPGLTLVLTDATRTLEGCNSVYAPVAFSSDGKRLVTNCGPSHNTVKVWDFATGQGLWESPEQPTALLLSVAFSPDGSRVVSCDYSGNVLVWDAATGEQLLSLKGFTGSLQHVTYSPDGSLIAAAGQEGVIVWNAWDGSRRMGMSTNALAVDFSPDGKRLAVTRGGTLEMWDVTLPASGELAKEPTPELGWDYEVSDDLTQWIVSRWDGVIEFIRSDTFETFSEWQVYTPTVEEPEIYFVPMLNRDNTLLATAHDELLTDTVTGTITIWDVATRRKKMELKASGGARFSAFNPDSTLLASGEYEGVNIWDLTTGKKLRTLSVPLKVIWWFRFSPDGTHLAVNGLTDPFTGFDQRILIWDLTPGVAQLADPIEIKAFKRKLGYFYFSPDGQSLVASTEGVKVFDVNTGAQRLYIPGYEVVSQMSMYSPDGKYIVACWDNGVTRVYDAQTGIELIGYRSPGNYGDWMVSFTPDGQRIIILGSDNHFQQYAFLNFEDLVAIARARVSRTWTQEECRKYLHSQTCP